MELLPTPWVLFIIYYISSLPIHFLINLHQLEKEVFLFYFWEIEKLLTPNHSFSYISNIHFPIIFFFNFIFCLVWGEGASFFFLFFSGLTLKIKNDVHHLLHWNVTIKGGEFQSKLCRNGRRLKILIRISREILWERKKKKKLNMRMNGREINSTISIFINLDPTALHNLIKLTSLFLSFLLYPIMPILSSIISCFIYLVDYVMKNLF